MSLVSTFIAAANPVGHVTDKPLYDNWVISNATIMLIISGVLTVLLVMHASKKIATGNAGTLEDLQTRGTLANLFEFISLYLRDEIFKPLLKEETDNYIGVLWTFFWFILINNLLGLVPILDITAMLGINTMEVAGGDDVAVGIGGTATQSIWVTGSLATLSFLFMNGSALKKDPVGFFKHLTAGAPVFMWPIMIPVEIIGTFVKPIALALRLFANMTGGHIIVATLLGFVVSLCLWGGVGYGMAIIPLLGTIAIYFLEILVAFIQAFIFTYLTGMFLSQLVVHDHDHDHDHGHGEEHAHGH